VIFAGESVAVLPAWVGPEVGPDQIQHIVASDFTVREKTVDGILFIVSYFENSFQMRFRDQAEV
jgi:hypothetical protein